ncbi:MAG: hypothetical protein HYW14_06200 [Planctomycetes bacterium]|nr:hypothetical protein [Planctomycetota bacterium]
MAIFRPCGKKVIRLKAVSNLILVTYILLCLTAGGLHRSLESGVLSLESKESGPEETGLTTHDSQLTTHNADTCLLCQWLKNPTAKVHTIIVNWRLLPIISDNFHYNNTLSNILHANNFLTRAPPAYL